MILHHYPHIGHVTKTKLHSNTVHGFPLMLLFLSAFYYTLPNTVPFNVTCLLLLWVRHSVQDKLMNKIKLTDCVVSESGRVAAIARFLSWAFS